MRLKPVASIIRTDRMLLMSAVSPISRTPNVSKIQLNSRLAPMALRPEFCRSALTAPPTALSGQIHSGLTGAG